MDSVNGQFPRTDVALVVGANDVVNPAARNSPGSPIYGMPILDADKAKSVVFLKRSMRPGFAGIENELLYDAADHAGLRRRQGHAHQDRRRAQVGLAHPQARWWVGFEARRCAPRTSTNE